MAKGHRAHPAPHNINVEQGGSCAYDAWMCMEVAHRNVMHYASVAVRLERRILSLKATCMSVMSHMKQPQTLCEHRRNLHRIKPSQGACG